MLAKLDIKENLSNTIKGAAVTRYRETPLFIAAMNGQEKQVEILLDKKETDASEQVQVPRHTDQDMESAVTEGCDQQVPLDNLLVHMVNGSKVHHITDGVFSHEFYISRNDFTNTNDNTITWKAKVVKFQEQSFMLKLSKVGRIFYSFIYIYGDIDQAKKYMATISIGHGTQSGIVHHGKIFPIDMKGMDILKEHCGVLSFSTVGMGGTFFCDKNVFGLEKKALSVRVQISKATSQNNPTPKVEHFQLTSLGPC